MVSLVLAKKFETIVEHNNPYVNSFTNSIENYIHHTGKKQISDKVPALPAIATQASPVRTTTIFLA